jgi:tetratricopeptide (TPR) repeat protein
MKRIILLIALVTNGLFAKSQDSKQHFNNACDLYSKKEYSSAIAEFNVHLTSNPNDAAAVFNRALCKYALKAFPEAEADFLSSIEKGRDKFDSWYGLGLCYFDQKNYTNAVKCFDRSIKMNAVHGRSYIYKAASLYFDGKAKEALSFINVGLELEKDNDWGYFYRSKIKYALNDIEGSFKDADKAAGMRPHVSFYFQRGFVALELKKYEVAMMDFVDVVANDPKNADAWYDLAVARMNKGDNAKALADFDRAIELVPSRYDFYYSRGLCKLNLKQYESAIPDFNAAADLSPNSCEAYVKRGACNLMLNNYETAVADFSKAVKLNAQCGEAYYYRALAYNSMSNKDGSCSDIKMAAQLNFSLAGGKLQELGCN